MTVLSEGDLRLTLPGRTSARVFDDQHHGLSHCMTAVDWILDLPERIYFIEVKDPEDPEARRYRDANDFLQDFLEGQDHAQAGRQVSRLVSVRMGLQPGRQADQLLRNRRFGGSG